MKPYEQAPSGALSFRKAILMIRDKGVAGCR
jgi:hypothetical protein